MGSINMETKKVNEFATAARDMIFSGGAVVIKEKEDDDDGAIDDGDADEEMVHSKRNFSQLRIQKRNSEAGLLKKVIPFHWAPMLSPLTENDIDTCVTLENVALSEARYRSPRDKVSHEIHIKLCCSKDDNKTHVPNPWLLTKRIDRVSYSEVWTLLWPVQHREAERCEEDNPHNYGAQSTR